MKNIFFRMKTDRNRCYLSITMDGWSCFCCLLLLPLAFPTVLLGFPWVLPLNLLEYQTSFSPRIQSSSSTESSRPCSPVSSSSTQRPKWPSTSPGPSRTRNDLTDEYSDRGRIEGSSNEVFGAARRSMNSSRISAKLYPSILMFLSVR